MSCLVCCRGLLCRLGGQLVLDGLDFDIGRNEAIALLGSSGSGKSTLLRMIAGLEVGQRGEILIDGRLATHDGRLITAPHRRGIAMLFQDLALWPNLTVAGNVCLGLSGQRMSRAELRARAGEALAQCGIADLAGRRPGTLSGGQQQRLALARALAMRPGLLLLDEPLSGLDVVTKASLLHEIARLKAELGLAIVLVTHDPVEVQALCDTLALLEEGRIVQRGPPDEIAANPMSELAKVFAEKLVGK